MIRSCNIPPLLDRITGNGIREAMVVTSDGELLGTSRHRPSSEVSDKATLITDIALDYIRLGTELNQRQLTYSEIEMGSATIGIASAGPECFVIAIAERDVASGLLKAQVTACASHVRGSLMPLTDAP
mmetsp:Transcript_649/g.776  ORF Transcript_649/g.776 Transcript_649/m.776 type:complete len:128 (+) Transcript_649:98-481(+)|eukprot:CAMPEP_0194179108 /NCGR_PEP_ID=MMETSP0154-20130528/12619_1 /TAXON_ID=1049557 /ORGANISM="Thalassiothrix antarctica, Strain L6-D1" /LENGTH=127 /DNA_ID=CAMNT_0038894335 /DNA_START=85 /DNA_END=468 /DNA_ORIENTATION=-